MDIFLGVGTTLNMDFFCSGLGDAMSFPDGCVTCWIHSCLLGGQHHHNAHLLSCPECLQDLLSKMPKGGTLINTARVEVVHEADMLEILKTRPDFCYLCDVAPKDIEPFKAAIHVIRVHVP